MLDIGSSELLLIVIVAVVVIGPKDLPRVLYKLGQLLGKGRAMTRHFRSGIDEMIRQAELEEMEKKWAADNARIMAQAPAVTPEAETPQLMDATPPAMEPLVAVDSYDPPEASPAFQVDPAAPSSAVHPDAEPHKPDPAA